MWTCACGRLVEKRGEKEVKAEEDPEDAEGTESGLDELMLLAGSRRLSEEPEKAAEQEAGALPQPEAPAAANRDDEVMAYQAHSLPA